MKLKHLGYYQADYPTLGLSDVDPGAEVELADADKAKAVMVEGIFAPGDPEAKALLIAALIEQAKAEREAAEAAVVEDEPAPDHTEALAAAQAAMDEAIQAAAKADAKKIKAPMAGQDGA
ncbi:MAG: hypothetical protein IPJ61_21430 [Tessaracoccus sp.]|uniref:hypothetical protein n=1 Tax=Tessaracoccus sp. TaxID=1971211 RepID=UPI001EB7C58F|nr:hypothetical protein [Tessaracoccus sp.]MBK7823551.1 hypothetical protein [Tessaracoccus sp.]